MASHARSPGREHERRLSIRTLVIASIASLTAAIVTSYFWRGGTPIAAALTPVIVAIVSELLHRPTEKIAERFTSEGTAVLPDAGGAAPPPRPGRDPLPERAPAEPGSQPEPGPVDRRPAPEGAAPVRVYGAQGKKRRRIAVGVVAATAALAFAIAAAALTLPELIAGEPIGKSDGKTTIFGGRDRDRQDEPEEETPPAQTQPTEEEETAPQETTPEDRRQARPRGGAAPRGRTETTPEPTTPTQPAPGEPAPPRRR